MNKEAVKNATKIIDSLKGKLFYTFNDSASNPIIAKVAHVSGDKIRYYRFSSPGSSYNGFYDATIDELFDNWQTSHEDVIAAANVRRKEYFEEYKEEFKEINRSFESEDREYFVNKLVEYERMVNQKTS